MRLSSRSVQKRSDRIALNLTSMIDVTFLLLIYFMVTTIMVAPEDRLSPTLQTEDAATSGAVNDFQPQVVRVRAIDGTPTYVLGAKQYHDDVELLESLKQLPTSAGIFIRVEAHVAVGFAVAAVQAAHDAGFEQVTYVPASD